MDSIAHEVAERSWREPVALFKNYVGYVWHYTWSRQYEKALKRKGTELIGVYSQALVEYVKEDMAA